MPSCSQLARGRLWTLVHWYTGIQSSYFLLAADHPSTPKGAHIQPRLPLTSVDASLVALVRPFHTLR